MGKNHAPFKGGVGQNLANRGWSARVWVTRREPRSHVVGLPWCPRHSSASSRHTGPCGCVQGVPRYSVYRHRISTGLEAGCRHLRCLLAVPRWPLLGGKSALNSDL
jgi:hypothetical protein